VNITRSRALENEDRLSPTRSKRMRERMTVLRDTLHHFSQREQELRLLAGLTPNDTTVQQAASGAGARVRSAQLKASAPAGQQALAARADVECARRRANILCGR